MTRVEKVQAIEKYIPTTETELLEFTAKLKEQFAKTRASSGKPTPKQVENAGIKDIILTALATLGKPVQVGELNKVPEVKAVTDGSSQRTTALLTQLKADGKVVRVKEGKVTLYSLATESEVDA